MVEASQCGICHVADADVVETLMCGHVFHSECVEGYQANLQISKMQIKCPTCRQTGYQMIQLEERAGLIEGDLP